MIKMIVGFVLLSAVIGGIIYTIQKLNNREQWKLAKLTLFAVGCSSVAAGIMFSIVYLF